MSSLEQFTQDFWGKNANYKEDYEMPSKQKIAAIACLFIITASATIRAGSPLSSEQITETFSGNTTEVSIRGTKYYTLINADGTIAGKGGGDTDTGTWRVSEEGYWCRTWTKWGSGKEGCFEVTHSKKDKYKFKRKSGTSTQKVYKTKFLEGNPKNI